MAGDKPAGCVLCQAAQSADDAAAHILYRGQHTFVLLNRFPYNSGHLMVLPYEHLGDFTRLEPQQLAEMMDISQAVLEVFRDCLHAEGVNLGMNLGQAAGAGINDHLHLHMVPRWVGDTNFLTALEDTRVVPQSLADCAAAVGPALRQVMQERTAARS